MEIHSIKNSDFHENNYQRRAKRLTFTLLKSDTNPPALAHTRISRKDYSRCFLNGIQNRTGQKRIRGRWSHINNDKKDDRSPLPPAPRACGDHSLAESVGARQLLAKCQCHFNIFKTEALAGQARGLRKWNELGRGKWTRRHTQIVFISKLHLEIWDIFSMNAYHVVSRLPCVQLHSFFV